MYVKEITLEGFKSYAQRTVVSGFDPQFNAITGLNGSGKSNILDSICFVLGITNLQQVRASNLQELVYKQGQAGITKATVSIVFDNSDRKRSPIGYEDMNEITVTRQIVIGGRNKYQINGHVAQPTVVQNLYHSVQLNINNPHFLIMQGRITKVLNMKPPEILAMLEEAAGTKMYESKKEVALKTLEKKQTKVDQIDSLLSQDILPALEKLRRERAQYQQWTAGNAQVDRLERFCLAYEFSEAERVKEAASGEASLLLAKVDSLKSATARIQEDIVQNEASVASLTHAKEKQMNREMKSFSDRVDKLSIALVKIDSAFNAKEESFGADKAAVEQLQRNAKDLACVIATETAAERQAEEGFLELKQKVEQQGKKLEDLERDYQGIQAGKGSGADEKSLADQRDDANAAVGKTAIEVEQSRTKIKHLDKELNEKQQHFKSKQHEVVAAREELQTRTAELKKLQDAIDNTGFEEGRMDFLEQSQRTETETVRRLKTEVSNLMGDLSGLQFSYNDPERGFDRSRVKGPVARLLRVKDASTMTALEVIAGSKLYNIVVDTEQTAKLLLEKGGLRQRVTFIPLNKIQCNPIPSRTQTAAAKLVGPTMARPALSLVDYDNELEVNNDIMQRAMAFVFGGAFVCNDIVTAKKVAFHKDINTKSVTLQGDVFEPHGLLTGGSRRNGGERLMKLRALEEAEGSLAEHVQALSKIEKEIASLAPIQKKYAHLKSQLELKSYDLSLYQTRAEQSEHHKLSEVISTMATELEAEQKDLANKEIRHKQLIKKVSDLDRAINEHDRDRDTRLKDVERSIASTKKEMAAASKDLKEKEGARERLLMEREVAVREKLDIEKQVVTALAQLKKMEAEVAQLSNERESMKKEYLNAQAELNKERDRIKDCDAEISRMIKHQNQLKTKHTDNVVEIKKLENEIKRMDAEQKECAERVEKLLKNHPWIAREKPMFGKPGTDYDFSTQDARGARELLETKLAEQKNTEKRINKKALAMFDKAEEEYKDLIERKRIVQNDKAKIQQVIKELDEKRKDQLRKTWMTVTKGFGSIFSTLLPGTTSELQPPEDADFMDGLEVRVAFGGVWKKSLSELSGGQRSLLALSLILALLLFKPAPLYILDEVDAALDLSHTQNIGRMIKSHFPQSQFIIVSLKEGMFNNANVLFRTKFVDGLSTVTRTVHRK